MNRDRTPILSPDGIYYCSPACGGGKLCKKADYDLAVKRADELAATMGEGWTTEVWENLGWHYCVKKGCMTIRVSHYKDDVRYSAWIEPGITVGRSVFQIIEDADDPQNALGIAKQKAWEVISRVRAALTDLEGDL